MALAGELPTDLRSYDGKFGFDGSNWILETVIEGRYRMMARWSPEDETNARGLEEFVALTNLLLQQANLYTPIE